MSNKITIRIADKNDVDTIMTLGIKTFRDTFEQFNTKEDMDAYLSSTFTAERILNELAEQNAFFFLAEDANTTIGYARVRISEKPEGIIGNLPIEIERLYARQDYIGKKIGSLLMQHCIDHAIKNHHDVIWLGVWEHNHRAIAFYEKWGFEKFGDHTFMVGSDAQTDILMQKKLK